MDYIIIAILICLTIITIVYRVCELLTYLKENKRLDKENVEIRTFYICNRKKCNNCSSECHHCNDIEHAKNFEKIGAVYFEKDI